jgi:protein-disulfide isomerase
MLRDLLVALFISAVVAQVPIPSRPDGYGKGGPADAHVVVEMFLDPICGGCKAAWPTVLQLIQAYGDRIHVRIHTFPLPYHTNSFVASQGLHVVANVTNRNIDKIYQYATKIFDNQQMWYNDATKSMTMPQVIDSLASYVDRVGLISKSAFLNGMTNDDINDETRISWKYACSRGVTGTPTFFINGVATSASSAWSLDDWKSVIDPILASNGQSTATVNDCPPGQVACTYAPHQFQCCLAGERCIPNVGCRCFTRKNGAQCDEHH